MLDLTQEVYSLFEGRHELPKNNGAIFNNNFTDKLSLYAHSSALRTTLRSTLTKEGKIAINEENTINIIVTGMTPALCWFINASRAKRINTWHYNKDTEKYFCIPIVK